MENIDDFLSGQRLYGDDFTLEQIREWYDDEKEGYAELGAKDRSTYTYLYHSLNYHHGFKYLKGRDRFNNVLGVGSAYGDEFLPILPRIKSLTLLDPSDVFSQDKIHDVPCTYVKPAVDGSMPFEDQSFDLTTCLGVLHHIPNVTTVVNEVFRCLSVGGYVVVREPITSMGDWTKPRPGLTKRERGIPVGVFRNIVQDAGFVIVHEAFCMFPVVQRICKYLRLPLYNSAVATWLDAQSARAFSWNARYHADKWIQKFRPGCIYFVLTKCGQ